MKDHIMPEHVKDIEIRSYSSYADDLTRVETFVFSSSRIYHYVGIKSKYNYPLKEMEFANFDDGVPIDIDLDPSYWYDMKKLDQFFNNLNK